MEEEGAKNNLVTFYTTTARDFLKQWPATPNLKELEQAEDDEQAQELADRRTIEVSHCFSPFHE